jgi:hypothetical protein
MMMSPQFAQATSALASSPAFEGTTELARVAAAMSAERMVEVGRATMVFFFATGKRRERERERETILERRKKSND